MLSIFQCTGQPPPHRPPSPTITRTLVYGGRTWCWPLGSGNWDRYPGAQWGEWLQRMKGLTPMTRL